MTHTESHHAWLMYWQQVPVLTDQYHRKLLRTNMTPIAVPIPISSSWRKQNHGEIAHLLTYPRMVRHSLIYLMAQLCVNLVSPSKLMKRCDFSKIRPKSIGVSIVANENHCTIAFCKFGETPSRRHSECLGIKVTPPLVWSTYT